MNNYKQIYTVGELINLLKTFSDDDFVTIRTFNSKGYCHHKLTEMFELKNNEVVFNVNTFNTVEFKGGKIWE